MKTEASEYMELLQEIQNSNTTTFTAIPTTEDRFIIDSNTRTISVPTDFSFLSVQFDHKAETVYFEIDRYFDIVDLSQHTCVIQYINSKSEGTYVVPSMDLDTIDGKIIFPWEIESSATHFAGEIAFSVRFYTANTDGTFIYNFNTLPAKSSILGTLGETSTDLEIPTSDLEAWTLRMNNLVASVENRLNEVFTSVSNGKTLVASAITDKGVETANDATFQTMANNIAQIKSGGAIQTLKSTSVLLGLMINSPTQYHVNNKTYTLTSSVTVNEEG